MNLKRFFARRPRPVDAVLARLIELLTDPKQEWEFSDHVVRHVPSGVYLWTSNHPVWDCNTYPVRLPLRYWNKHRLAAALNVARINWTSKRLNKS